MTFIPSFHAVEAEDALIRALERWNRLTLGLIQSVGDDTSVPKIDFAVRLLLPCQGMFHPVLVVSVGDYLISASGPYP